jgi:hypothetical protein
MSKVKVVLKSEGIQELLRSDEIQEECRKQAQRVAQRAGVGYTVEDRNYPERSGAAVKATSIIAKIDNAKNNTLLKALGND